jgi:hypothetical protein
MILRTGGGHHHRARSLRGGDVFGGTGDGGQLIAINHAIKQSSNQAIINQQSAISNQQSAISNQARKCFYHRGTRENDQVHGVGKDFGASRKKVGQTSREAQPLAYSVDSIVLPCSSVIKTLA